MLSKILMNYEINFVEDILTSLEPDPRKAAIKNIKNLLRQKGITLHSRSDIPSLAEEHLTIKDIRNIFRESHHLKHVDHEEIKKLKAYYLSQRIERLTSKNDKLRRTISRELKKVLLLQGIIANDEAESWTGLKQKQRMKNIIFYSANYLNYLELEDVFNRILSKDSLSIVVKEARNIDLIKNMSNSEILPFLQKLIIHEKELSIEDKQEALETIIEVFISDHHYYKVAANKFFSLTDVYEILERRICLPDRQGKIGQKAAGMILAYKILTSEKNEFSNAIRIPESYYLTSDVFFESLSSHTYNFSSLKHRLKEGTISEPELMKEYPEVQSIIMNTVLPDIIRIELRKILSIIGDKPVITRSSSLLEDSASAFSGKYDSYFYANQRVLDDPGEDLERRVDKLIENILRVYASALRPEALIYRRERGLLDVDERMCVLIQTVEGARYGKYYFPSLAGVGLSYNHRTNTEKIKWNDPVLRIGFGLGTGIVDIKGNHVKVVYPGNPDYSLAIDFQDQLKTSQRKIDVLDLETDTVETISKDELFDYFNTNLKSNISIREFVRTIGKFFLSTAEQDYLKEGIGLASKLDKNSHVITLQGMKQTKFYQMTDWALHTLTKKYQPSDMEFTIGFKSANSTADEEKNSLDFEFAVVQCRQLTGQLEHLHREIPVAIPEKNIFCKVKKSVTSGFAPNIEIVVLVDPDKYYNLDETRMYTIARYIGQINYSLTGRRFILIGPGRWGSSTPQYGVKVSYSEIYHTLALVEIARKLGDDRYAETSLGSHFGNDVREGEIVTFSIYPEYMGTIYQRGMLDDCMNIIDDFFPDIPMEDWVREVIKVVDVKTIQTENIDKKSQVMHIIANSEEQQGIIFLDKPSTTHKIKNVSTRTPAEEVNKYNF